MKPFVIERQVVLRVPRERLWPVLRDTDRLNRAQGLPPVRYHVLPGTEGEAEVEGEARIAGWRIRWVEHPFEWVEGRRHFVVRRYHNGPFREFRGGVLLADQDGGTRVTAHAEFYPRNPLGWVVARLAGPRMVADFEKLCLAVEAQLRSGQPVVLPGEAPADPAPALQQVRRVLERSGAAAGLSAGDPLVMLLADYLAGASDREVTRIRPFALARQWDRPGMDVLRLCLRATRAGLLELSWDVVCPNCRGRQRAASLSEIALEGHCETCQIRFDLNFDRALEVSFRVHPQVRKAEDVRFCAFGPGNTPHIVSQLRLEPGGRVEETVRLAEGRYRVRSPEAPAAVWLDAGDSGASAARVRIRSEGTESDPPAVAAGEVGFLVENLLPSPARLVLERSEWAQDVATAALVSTVQEFRDLFSTEALSEDVQLSIASLTFLFTDLKGSTALYSQWGDARAYALVRDHFAFLFESIYRHEGSIVKTIGDAIMAVFYDPCHALKCSLAVQGGVRQFNKEHPPGAIVVKMGLHGGPCLAVRLNDRLDYFGTTVNMAARVQNLSDGDDIVVTEAITRDSLAAALLQRERPVAEELHAEFKGLAGRFRVCRLRPASQPARTSSQ